MNEIICVWREEELAIEHLENALLTKSLLDTFLVSWTLSFKVDGAKNGVILELLDKSESYRSPIDSDLQGRVMDLHEQ